MIIPEIDGPAHVSSGFEWGVGAGYGDLIVCADPDGTEDGAWHRSSLEPASGQINLANDNFYTIMRDVYSELANIFSLSEYFHVGGDEIIVGGSDESAVSCYNNSVKSPDIISLLESNGLDRNSQESFYALWQNYTYKVSDLVEKAFQPHKAIKKLHIWGGGGDDETGTVYNLMTREDATTVLPPVRYNVQVWDESKGSIVPDLTAKGYDVILSNTDYVYLDCGSSGWIHPGGYWCQPYHEWYKIYEYINDVVSMWGLTSDQLVHVIGSETLAWSELIDATNIEQKMWPRTAALAEALWGRVSAEKTATWYRADPRMQHWRTVLVQRGVNAEPLQTKWCQQRGAYACSLDQGIPQ
jgi:N-acetyl-beta-hexosaminidase